MASAGCQPPQETTVPFHDMPESLVDGVGRARFFTTVLDGSPVLVRTREGRPILVTPNPKDASGRGLSLRHHAALMDLYDPDRAQGPVSVRRGKGAPVASSWPRRRGPRWSQRLKQDGEQAVLLTGPGQQPVAAGCDRRAAGADRPAARGLLAARGRRRRDRLARRPSARLGSPRPRLDKADLIVGFGAEFLDRPADGLERDFALRRAPEQGA